MAQPDVGDLVAVRAGEALNQPVVAQCFILALVKVAVPFSLVTRGLALLAVHLAWPIAIRGRR